MEGGSNRVVRAVRRHCAHLNITIPLLALPPLFELGGRKTKAGSKAGELADELMMAAAE